MDGEESYERDESQEGSLHRGISPRSGEGEGVYVNSTGSKPLVTAEVTPTTLPTSPSAGHEPVIRGKKCGRSPPRNVEPTANSLQGKDDTDSESKGGLSGQSSRGRNFSGVPIMECIISVHDATIVLR